jgi:hypothetical protein
VSSVDAFLGCFVASYAVDFVVGEAGFFLVASGLALVGDGAPGAYGEGLSGLALVVDG